MLRVEHLLLALLSLTACKKQVHSGASVPFSDNFDRQALGSDWYPSGGHWIIDNNAAYTTGANNAPCFLKAALPADVVIEIDVKSETTKVDCKIELMTDGRTHQSGYIFILGGWDNKLSVIARLDEHGDDRKVKSPTGMRGGENHRWRIEKKGGNIRWLIDGKPYMTFEDPAPLDGKGHDRLALSNWQNQIRYDNLQIWAYDDAPPANR